MNASPDLHNQVEACPDLQPSPDSPRNTPIAGVVLTNSDLDHVLGLLSLREGNRLNVYATEPVRQALDGALGLRATLDSFCGVNWQEPPTGEFLPILIQDKTVSPVRFRAIPLPGKPPPFARDLKPGLAHSIACQFFDPSTGRRLLVAPDVSTVTDDLLQAMRESEAVLFDGTFWSAAELSKVKAGAPPAAGMGHVTIEDCTLGVLSKLKARLKVYVHINNTNPVLDPHSAERATVETAGIVVGADGMEFEV